MKRMIKTALRRFGYDIVRYNSHPSIQESELATLTDLSEQDRQIVSRVKPFTMTTVERIAALLNAVRYVTESEIPGDIAECGVWRGGSMMTVALVLLACGDTKRTLYLYDTFEGMPPPTDSDVKHDGVKAADEMKRELHASGRWCYASKEDVRENLLSTGYPSDRIRLIKGKVEDTIPATIPGHLSLLRLDTDWYESTRHELLHLFPILDAKGVLIVDDYGHWLGARKAVDEYFAQHDGKPFLHRIDFTGRILVRNGS